jgi:transposase
MLHVDHARWGQTPEDLRQLATSAAHQRTRERFLALYEITRESCATRVAERRVAERTGRHPQTVMEWLHLYNERGPAALAYRRTGGRPPFARSSRPGSAQRSERPSRSRPAHPSPGPTRSHAGR